jgi:hypothetical protein
MQKVLAKNRFRRYTLGMSSPLAPALAPALASVIFDTGSTHSGLTVSPSPSLLVIFGQRKLISFFYSIEL